MKKPGKTPAPPRSLGEDDKAGIRAALEALRQSPGFRTRGAQNAMIAIAARALGTSGGGAVIEAPTGVGKSLAYLTAAVPIAIAHQRPLVIATATVSLQEQLVQRDIPRFLADTGLTATVAIAKGRQRYACLRNLAEAAGGGDGESLFDFDPAYARSPSAEEAKAIEALSQGFDAGTWQGDLDLSPVPLPDGLRGRITTSAGACTRANCAFAEACPYLRARAGVKAADIVVANHDLVLAALGLPDSDEGDNPILPTPSKALFVFDEGHHLPAKAIDADAAQLHLPTAIEALERGRGPLSAAFVRSGKDAIGGLAALDVQELVTQARDALRDFSDRLALAWVPDPAEAQPTWRAPMGQLPEDWRDEVRELDRLFTKLSRFADTLVSALPKQDGGQAAPDDKLMRNLGRLVERLQDASALWQRWARQDVAGRAPMARWLTVAKDRSLLCHAAPVSAAGILRQLVWGRVESVVVTSATLAAGGDFRHFREEAAIPDDWELASLPSPFNLAESAVLSVPAMQSLPDDAARHTDEVARWVEDELDWDAGNLVLFTSWRQMERVVALLSPARAIRTLVQGSRSRTELLAKHAESIRAGKGSTLFGLASFGEGLDLAGDLATTVVIAKLPFAMPSDPVGATKAEWYESRGRSAFFEVALPEAQRTLTQYMGRLIRTEHDRGRIVLLDRRVVVKRYGRVLLDSLPPYRRLIA
ncbi:MAG TPA: ATP-dependent DNA helicase DinG [Arenimonas sp.]|uniref:ATP-dependent DNA helicase DinG n=1 Tax=Arenimonas sp. TaxID=1872635 RepID=UPI002D7E382C|nr:ATP-dependent DNA helicase DinG [Arenimonas sp.]HEU0153642.1 ATP-dependent DNA helicase DinG [Arenimonas sp.]